MGRSGVGVDNAGGWRGGVIPDVEWGVVEVSDTKILSGEQVRNVFRMGSDISMVQVCESHYAQAQKIKELEEELQHRIPVIFADALEQERDAAILRAEATEAQVKQLGKWLNCGGVPTDKTCSVDGHLIYGGFHVDADGTRAICDIHMLQQVVAQIKAMLGALPGERALEIAKELGFYRASSNKPLADQLRAYAAVAKGKG